MDISSPVVVALNIFDPALKSIFLNESLTNEDKVHIEYKSSDKEACEDKSLLLDEDPDSLLWVENETVLCDFLNYILHEHGSRTRDSSNIVNPIEMANTMLKMAESRLEGALGAEVFSCYDDFFDSKRELSFIKSSFITLNSTGLSFHGSVMQIKDYWKTCITPIDSSVRLLSCVHNTLKILRGLSQFQVFVEALKKHWNSVISSTQHTVALSGTDTTVSLTDSLDVATIHYTMNGLVTKLLELCSSNPQHDNEQDAIQQLKFLFPHLTDDLCALQYYNNVLISNSSTHLLNGIEKVNVEEVRQGILTLLYYKQDTSLVSSQLVSLFLQWIHHIQNVMCHHDSFKKTCEKSSSASFYDKVMHTKSQDKQNSNRDELNFLNFFTSTLSEFENIMTKVSTLHVILDNIFQTCRPIELGEPYDAKLFYTSLIQNIQKSLNFHYGDYLFEGNDITEYVWITIVFIMKQKLQSFLSSKVILQLVLDRFPLLIASLLTTEKNLIQDIKKRKCDLNLYEPQPSGREKFPTLLQIVDFVIDSYINTVKQNLRHPISFMFPDTSTISNKYLRHTLKTNSSLSLPTTSDMCTFVNVIAKELQKVYHCPILFKKVLPLVTDVLQEFTACLQMQSSSEEICFLITSTNEHIFPRVTKQFELNTRLHTIGYIMLQLLSKSFRLEIFPRCFHFSIKTIKLQLSNNFYFELMPIIQDLYHQNNRFVSQVYTQLTHYVCESNLALFIPMLLNEQNKFNHEDIMKRIARVLNHIQTKFCVSIPKPTHFLLGGLATSQILSYFLAIASNMKPLKTHTIQILIQVGTQLLKILSQCFYISLRNTDIFQIHWLQNFLDILKQELLFVTIPIVPEKTPSQDFIQLNNSHEPPIQYSQPEDQILQGIGTMFLSSPTIKTKQIEKKEYLLPNWLWLLHLVSFFPETDIMNFLQFSNENGISKNPITYQNIASLISDTSFETVSQPYISKQTNLLFEATCFINLINTSNLLPSEDNLQSTHVLEYKQNILSYIKKHMLQLHQPRLIHVTQNS